VSANSVYGFTGATVGALPSLEISASTTSYGGAAGGGEGRRRYVPRLSSV